MLAAPGGKNPATPGGKAQRKDREYRSEQPIGERSYSVGIGDVRSVAAMHCDELEA
jgi:hypothetical protein